ncbi:MAG: S-layer homology domain-containing protein [Schaedlerella sp.]|nr:S-layer homology domain-containing protein [Lachnospiraceae bacterium]MDY4202272.1 S-layer homology domain-containing protein [Schaedlerella sp.]
MLTVDADGNIKALWPGEAVVTAKAGDKSADIKVTVYGVEKIYDDVNKGDWYYDASNWTYINDVMSGYGNGIFGASDTLARAQFAVILYRIAGGPEVEFENRFPDVTENDWFADAVIWANDNTIITGYTATGRFGSADNITREQIAAILYRYAKSEGYDVTASDNLEGFPDAPADAGAFLSGIR